MGPSRVATISSIAVCVGGAAVALVHYYAGSGSPGRPEGWLSAVGFAAPIFGAGLVGAFALTVFHQDPAEWSGPDGPEGSSNIVTNTEALFAIASAVGANVVATIVATKDRHRPKLTL